MVYHIEIAHAHAAVNVIGADRHGVIGNRCETVGFARRIVIGIAAYKPDIGVFLLQCHHDFGGIGVNTVRHSAEKLPLALGVCADYLALKPILQRSAARIAFVIPPCKPIGPVAGKGDGIFTRYVKLGRLKLHYSPSVV